jgi:uncharacterized phage-associated protein
MGLISPLPIANEFIKRAINDNKSLSPMKLQKLIWFTYGRYLADYNDAKRVLFDEPFLVWQYGPVLRSVFVQFASFGANNIDAYARDAKGIVFLRESIQETKNLIEVINDRWAKYKDYTAIRLSSKTHEDGTPWKRALDNNDNVISDDLIKEYFKGDANV